MVALPSECQQSRRPVVALVTTSNFRSIHQAELNSFILNYVPWLSEAVTLVATSGTFSAIKHTLESLNYESSSQKDQVSRVLSSIRVLRSSSAGMVQVAHELVEGRLSCLFHLSHYKDINTTLASAVVRRQATLWNIVFSDSITGACRIIDSWRSNTVSLSTLERKNVAKNLVKLSLLKPSQRNLALIAHDGRKMDLMLFAVENLSKIIAFDYILATGTTGSWLAKFLKATWPLLDNTVTPETIESKIICCESGPRGGDVQIAEAALRGLCSRIIFFIDPLAAHPHEPDIKFFEMALESVPDLAIHLATNEVTAKYLLNERQ